MNQTTFCLKAFPQSNLLPQIKIGGKVNRQSDTFTISYQISGDISQIHIPATQKNPTRQSNLWETTCLEFFLGIKNSPVYWEINLAPSGEWNVYRFTDYRTGMVEEEAIASLALTVKKEANVFELELALDLTLIIEPSCELELGITAVIESQQQISYWALGHWGTEADFHLRDSFEIEM